MTRGTVKKTNRMFNFFTPNHMFNFFTQNRRPRSNLGPLNIDSVFFPFYYFLLLGFYLTIDFLLNLYNGNVLCSNLEHIKLCPLYLFVIIIGFYIYSYNNNKNIPNLLEISMLMVLTLYVMLVLSIIDYYLTSLILLDPKRTFIGFLEVFSYVSDWKDTINIAIYGKYIFIFLVGLAVGFLIIYRKNIKNFLNKICRPFNKLCWPIALTRVGFYYGNKRDNGYICNLISNINKKYLGLEKRTSEGVGKINPDDIRRDLYSSSNLGSLFRYRNIKGYLSRSILILLIKKTQWITGLLLFLNRTSNVVIDFKNYIITPVFSFENLPILGGLFNSGVLSILDITELIFIICTIYRILEILLDLQVIPDKLGSVFNPKLPIFYPGLPRHRRFFFRSGVYLSGLLALLEVFGKLIFVYLILCQINLISPYIRIDSIFEFIASRLDYIFKFYGFEFEPGVKQKSWGVLALFFILLLFFGIGSSQ